jgi:hypothetical protein
MRDETRGGAPLGDRSAGQQQLLLPMINNTVKDTASMTGNLSEIGTSDEPSSAHGDQDEHLRHMVQQPNQRK